MPAPLLALDLWAMPGPGFLAALILILVLLGVIIVRAWASAKRDAAVRADLGSRLREAQERADRLAGSGNAIPGLSAGAGSTIDAHHREVDLDALLKRKVSELTPRADQVGIQLLYDGPETPIPIRIDEAGLGDVFSTLVGNALAHTPSGGEVTVYLLLEASRDASNGGQGAIARISIADTGERLKSDEAARFFEQDRHGSSALNRPRDAGSPRLTAAREFVVTHGGAISVRSRAAAGCLFLLEIPLGSGDAIEAESSAEGHPAVAPVHHDQPVELGFVGGIDVKPRILVVDDDEDLLDYLEGALQPAFRPAKARNGREALDLLKVEPPDLVLCDHGMPVMDGIELLEAVRSDDALRTIPFVLLTGRASVRDRVDGLRRGADAYIAKPFVVAEVVVQMQNLLRLREAMREQYGTQVLPVDTAAPEIPSADALFVSEARRVVEAHLADPEFDVRAMAEHLFVSERTLRRRIRDLTGYSAAKFILELRLQKARLLVDGNMVKTLSEAAAAVGFRDPGYFSRLLQSWRRDMMPDEE